MGSAPTESRMLFFVVMSVVISAASSSSISSSLVSSEYEEMGPLEVSLFQTSYPWETPVCSVVDVADVPASTSYEKPPARLVIAAPSSQSGDYPVFLFKHGTNLANCHYSQILEHIASYGYIVVAPQTIFNPFSMDCSGDIDNTAEVINWLPGNLTLLLASQVTTCNVTPDVGNLFLSGQSRGAKDVFALALGLSNVDLSAVSSFAGMVALDPVDAIAVNCVFFEIIKFTQPEVVSRSACDLKLPVLILGTGLGPDGWPVPCAPAGYNHQAFFDLSSAPIAYHIVASQYGHMDFLDSGFDLMKFTCVGGPEDGKLRPFAAGLALSFMESVLSGTTLPMQDTLVNWKNASIELEQPQCSNYQAAITCPGMSSEIRCVEARRQSA